MSDKKLIMLKATMPMPVSGDIYKYIWCDDVEEDGNTIRAVGGIVGMALDRSDVYSVLGGLGVFAPSESDPESFQAVL